MPKSTPKTTDRPSPELIDRLGIAVRKMGAQSVLTSEAVAGKFGLHKTDLESLDLIFLKGGVCSAGELSRATGLTSGSTTALIDRLEKAGYVRREPDSHDRRRQMVRIRPEAIEPIQAVYSPLQAEMHKLWSGYSKRDLELIADFIEQSTRLAAACLEQLGSAPSYSAGGRP
jgi:DNA-binding MarR family transcriptional regulator